MSSEACQGAMVTFSSSWLSKDSHLRSFVALAIALGQRWQLMANVSPLTLLCHPSFRAACRGLLINVPILHLPRGHPTFWLTNSTSCFPSVFHFVILGAWDDIFHRFQLSLRWGIYAAITPRGDSFPSFQAPISTLSSCDPASASLLYAFYVTGQLVS